MKKKIIMLALCVLLISGCGKTIPKLSNGDEAIVTLKDGQMISVNELYETMKQDDATLEKLVTMVDKKILEERYSNSLEEAKSTAESRAAEVERYYGENLTSILNQAGYADLDAYKDAVYLGFLQNKEITEYCKKQISDKEVNNYYKDNIVGDIKISHILITSKATDDMTDEEKANAEQEAKEKAQAIIDELNKTAKGEVADKFAELAKEQSEDASTKDNGGSLGWINKDTLSSEYDEIVKNAYKLKDGEYSKTILTTELGYHIIIRTETKDKAPIEDVRDDILETLASEYLQKNTVASVKALQEMRKEYNVEIVDSELQSRYAKMIQNMISAYQEQDYQNQTQGK